MLFPRKHRHVSIPQGYHVEQQSSPPCSYIMLKKSSVLHLSHSNFYCLYCCQPAAIPTLTSSHWHRSRYSDPANSPLRCFVHTRSIDLQEPSPHDLLWPHLTLPNAVPTPYQILNLKKDSPYSKRRFYELVKIYHPDRSGLQNGPLDLNILTRSAKIERYRLIVTAHEILSDPAKRCAYDKSGAGWDGRPDHDALNGSQGQSNRERWSDLDSDDSPFRNATWEDWEKWYQRGKAKQEPLYFSNGGFLMLVLIVVFLAGFEQSIRVREHSSFFQRHVEKVHDDASTAIRQRKTESQACENKDERLQKFLISRNPRGVTTSTEEIC